MAKQQQINLQVLLLVTGALFTALSAARACYVPFLAIYLRQLGLRASQTGIILGCKSVLVAATASCLGRWLMRFKSARIFLLLAILFYLTGVLSLSIVPPVSKGASARFCVGFKQSTVGSNSSQPDVMSSNVTKAIELIDHTKLASTESTPAQAPLTSNPMSHLITTASPDLVSFTKSHSLRVMSTTHVMPSSLPLENDLLQSMSTTPERAQPQPASKVASRPKTESFFDSHAKPISDTSYSVPLNQNLYPTSGTPVRNQYWPNSNRQYSSRHNEPFVSNKRYRNKQGHSVSGDGRYQSSYQRHPDWKWESQSDKEYDRYHSWNSEMDKDTIDPRKDIISDGYSEDVLDWLLGRDSKHPHMTGHEYRNKRHRRSILQTSQPGANDTAGEDAVFPTGSPEVHTKPSDKVSGSTHSTTFWIALFLVGVTELFAGPIEHMCDTALYHQLDNIDELDKYKRPTILATPIFAIVGLISAAIVDSTACYLWGETNHMVIHFYASAACIGVVFLAGLAVPLSFKTKSQQEGKCLKSFKLLYNDSHTAVMSSTLVVTALVSSCSDIFLFWLMQDLQSLETTMGLTIAIAYFTELPMSVVFTPWLVQKLGNVWLLALGTACLGVQQLYYSVLWAPWAAVPIQILHSLSRAAIRGCILAYLNEASPPGMGKMVQGTLLALEQGVGVALGGIMWGFLYGALEVKMLFVVVAVVAMTWTVLLIICACRLPVKKRFMYSKLLQSDMEMEMKGGVFGSDSEDNEEQEWLHDAIRDAEEE
ncbi:uncharacterized protein [Diadema setosum]|uniref:uncharacterized protein n=1 Tax=Diadema setosum TaxID=31175 RepID=UPI003B3A6F59